MGIAGLPMIAPAEMQLVEHTRRTVGWRLQPFLFILYIVNYVDRTNLTYAAPGMSRELGFNDHVFGFGAGIFFISYLALQIHGALLVERWSARRMISMNHDRLGLPHSADCAGAYSFAALRCTFRLGCGGGGLLSRRDRKIQLPNHFDQGGTTPVILAYATSWPMCSLLWTMIRRKTLSTVVSVLKNFVFRCRSADVSAA